MVKNLKKLRKCRVAIFLIAGWLILSVAGYLGKDSVYGKYAQDVVKTPYFVLVLQGIHDGIFPWSSEEGDMWNRPAQEGGGLASEETETEALEALNSAERTETPEPDETEIPEEKEFVQVDESYFDDAVFIGDSRTVGLHDYSGLDKATFYATVGLNVYDMWKNEFCKVDGKEVTLEEALLAKRYKKVYFQIGINEMGRGDIDSFMEAYSYSVQKFRKLQPDAVIFVQGIMKVEKSKSDSDPIFNNPGIEARNERIARLADNRSIFYIDVNEAVCDESGGLKPELTFDKLHLYGSKYDIWVDFLKTKGIE